ncbi:MAG: DnaJ domain-containing protein [Planctomycetota bacterium]|nr:DnaJ domain-containing protein [Planctomycetota bacterium]
MINYYEVLEVQPEAKPEEIRRSFRRLAKKYHPDHNSDRTEWAEAKIRVILKAYDTLMNATERAEYDKKLRPYLARYQDPYRENLAKRADDPVAQSRLILYNLLNDAPAQAVEIYERMKAKDESFEVSKYLDPKDYLDCEFLLGEEYERQGNWKQALRFYENVYNQECDSPMRFFLEEVKDRIRDIYCKKVARRCKPLDAVKIYEKVMAMGVSKKTEAYLHKKIAESYFKASLEKKAKFHLKRAFQLEPKLKGAQKICEKLGITNR